MIHCIKIFIVIGMTRFLKSFSLALVSIVAFAGCSPSTPATYPVYGKVVLEDGNPIQFGTVEFRLRDLLKQYKERIVARGKIEQDGSFRLSTFEPNDGAVPGDYEVIVNQLIISRDLSFEAHGHGPRVSPRYGDYALSGLSAKIEAIKDPQDKSTNQVVLKLLRDDGSTSRSP